MSTLYSSGKVTAYGAALDGGYTGTYEQFCQDVAGIATASTRTLANIVSAFDASAHYSVGDYVVHDGALYRCKTAHSGAWNAAHFETTTLVQYKDIAQIVKIASASTTLGDINTILNGTGGVNPKGNHVFFDLSALGVMMYLCTIFLDTANGIYKVFDLVSGRYAEGTYDASMLLTMATAQANGLAVQSQIDNLQTQIDELGGKHIVANYDVLGNKILDGTSTDIIAPGDIMGINWITSVLGTTTSGLTVSCSDIWQFAKGVGECEAKDYLFVYDGANWTFNEETVNLSDYALTVTGTPTAGEVMDIKTTVDSVPYTFTSYDTAEPTNENVPHNWIMEQTYAPDTKVYSTYQALFAVYQGKTVPVGNYHIRNYCYRSSFYIDMYLAVTSAIGSNDSIVQARSNGYTGNQTIENADGVTKTGVSVISGLTPNVYGTRTNASGAVSIAYAPADGVVYTELTDLNTDPNDPVVFVHEGVFDKCVYGDNCWANANISEYLNDESAVKSSISPTWMLYVPSSYNLAAGFLYGIDPRAYALIQPCDVEWTSGYGNTDYTQGQTYTKSQKVFLLSMKEMSFNLNVAEGEATELYSDYCGNVLTNNAVIDRVKYNRAGGTLNSYRWSRSAVASGTYYAWYVSATGGYDYYNARSAFYVAPAFILGKSTNQ